MRKVEEMIFITTDFLSLPTFWGCIVRCHCDQYIGMVKWYTATYSGDPRNHQVLWYFLNSYSRDKILFSLMMKFIIAFETIFTFGMWITMYNEINVLNRVKPRKKLVPYISIKNTPCIMGPDWFVNYSCQYLATAYIRFKLKLYTIDQF